MLACPFVDNEVIQSNIDFMNSMTVQTVQTDLVYMAITIVMEQRLDNCPAIKQSLTRKLAKNQKRVESETQKKN